eukprot:CAMPEP_0117622098 /NCGR_PEP_ID=MMETSP0784-20121206/87968_1 /TAXON_ID=39447 /ORGANISM="" /LENGTH=481 /DNA_ID=CAMNT_0005426031 /DNA_START=41 /DNA_END=1486 /DNA_ORIENTATION=-
MCQTIREIKAELTSRGVDFSHCFEKAELQQLLTAAKATEKQSAGAAAIVGKAVDVGAGAASDGVSALSVRDLKAELRERGVDFSRCNEKSELQALLRVARAKDDIAATTSEMSDDAESTPFSDGGFALRRQDGRVCWVEFVTDGDALCHWDDGADGVLASDELEPVYEADLPGPSVFNGTFEAARAEAFTSGRLLVALVRMESGRTSSKGAGVLALALASEEVAPLIEENAVFWRGSSGELRATHLQQLAPQGAPSLAMVLPLAVDAMRVLSHSAQTSKETLVHAFVEALEELEQHRDAAQARLASETALLRQEQDEEFEASLTADRERAAAEAEAACSTAPDVDGDASKPPDASQDLGTEDAKKHAREEEQEEWERRAKLRRKLADEFLAEPPPARSEGSTEARLVLRLPTGERVVKIYRWAECCSLLPEASGRDLRVPEHFELATSFPRRRLGPDAMDSSLGELGLTPSAALLLVDLGA